jgi:hypothetical protein
MTKGLPTTLFEEFRDNLCIRSADAMVEGGVSEAVRRETDSLSSVTSGA